MTGEYSIGCLGTIELRGTYIHNDSFHSQKYPCVSYPVVLLQLIECHVFLHWGLNRLGDLFDDRLLICLVNQDPDGKDDHDSNDEFNHKCYGVAMTLNSEAKCNQVMFSREVLSDQDYGTNNPYIKEYIAQAMREQMERNGNNPVTKNKKQSAISSQQKALEGLKGQNQFKNIGQIDKISEESNYEDDDEAQLKRERDYEIIYPQRFKIIGYSNERQGIKRRPIYRLTDVYLSSNSKVRNLIDSAFRENILGRKEKAKDRNLSKIPSNANSLEDILKVYENGEDDDNFQNREMQMDEEMLEQYVIDRADSKDLYFLYYKSIEADPEAMLKSGIKNNPVAFPNFISELHQQVADIERNYSTIDCYESDDQYDHQNASVDRNGLEGDKKSPLENGVKEVIKPVKEYFGQFKRSQNREKQFVIVEKKNDKKIASKVLQYLSHVDPDILQEKYKLPAEEHAKVEIDLSNNGYFLPKMHTVLDRTPQHLKGFEKRKANVSINGQSKFPMSFSHPQRQMIDGSVQNNSKLQMKHISNISSEQDLAHSDLEEDHMTVEKVIRTEMKNIYKTALKHSDVANKFELIKFSLQEQAFSSYHRYQCQFNEFFPIKTQIFLVPTKRHRVKPKGLVINVEMTDSNQRFSKKEDLSLSKGEFIMVEYIQQTPLLMSNVGMCQRMFNQVNFAEILQKIQTDIIGETHIEDLQIQRDFRSSQRLPFDQHCELWRKNIKEIFGENGKQIYWDPKQSGKLIGTPEGFGVSCMESDLFTVAVVKKPPPNRDFLLVREGKKWFLRKIDDIYVSGQIEPKMKVYCPGSRDYNMFKISYMKAFIRRQIKQYDTISFEQLRVTFKNQTETSLKKALKSLNSETKDNKTYRMNSESNEQFELSSEDVCLYERMQKSLCQLQQVGIQAIKSNEKMKNVLKEFNKKHYLSAQKFAIARMIREQLQLTSWYLTDSFLKYKLKTSKIEINGFADPTNGKGGYSYINKPQKERTSRQDMEDKVQKSKMSAIADLRKLNCNDSRNLLRSMGHNEDQIQRKSRWALISFLKNKEGTEYSRKERETKLRKMENEKKQISKNFNRLLKYLYDDCEAPAFDYMRSRKTTLEYYIEKEKENWQKAKRKFGKMLLGQQPEESSSQQGEDEEGEY